MQAVLVEHSSVIEAVSDDQRGGTNGYGVVNNRYHIVGHRPVTSRVSRRIVLLGEQARGKK